jgi:signal transduction histidine kinase
VGVSALVARGSSAGQEEIHISVRDRGLGISKQDLPHVFEPFYRSRHYGGQYDPVAAAVLF